MQHSSIRNLHGWQEHLHQTRPRIRLLGELVEAPAQCDELTQLLRQALRGPDSDRLAENLMLIKPDVIAVYLVAMGIYHYRDGDYWTSIRKHVPELSKQGEHTWRNGFLRYLRNRGLPTFAHVRGHRYLTPILAHGGIPEQSLRAFFERLLWPAVNEPEWAGLNASDLLSEWTDASWFERDLPRPVARFLKYGGQGALHFVGVCMDLASADDLVSCAAPSHIRAAFQQFRDAAGERTRREASVGPRYRRPSVRFDECTGIIWLDCPAQSVSPAMAASGLTWSVEVDGRRVRLPVNTLWESQGYQTAPTNLRLDAPPLQIRAALISKDQRLREWSLNFTSAGGLYYAADAVSGALMTQAVLPADALWLLIPKGADVITHPTDGEPTPARILAETELAPPWLDWQALLIDGQQAHELRVHLDNRIRSVLLEASSSRHEELQREAMVAEGPIVWALSGLSNHPTRIEWVQAPIRVDLPELSGADHPMLLLGLGEACARTVSAELVLDEGTKVVQVLPAKGKRDPDGRLTRARFDLAALTDALARAHVSTLVLRLICRMEDGSNLERVVARITQAWNPHNLDAIWEATCQQVQVRWSERVALAERYLWLWDLWRPWRSPIEASIPDDARGTFTLVPEQRLLPGAYRVQLAINSVWSPIAAVRPPTDAPGTVDLVITDDVDIETYLDGLGDAPLARAERFLARAGRSLKAVEDTYFLEAQVGAAEIDPLMRTLAAMERLSETDRIKWRDRMREIMCDYCAHDVQRWLATVWEQEGDAARTTYADALMDLGWLTIVGPNWTQIPRPVELGVRQLFPMAPLDDDVRERLWGIWPVFGLGAETWPLDGAAVTRIRRALGDTIDLYQPWRVGASVTWQGRILTVAALLPQEDDAGDDDRECLWRPQAPTGWRLQFKEDATEWCAATPGPVPMLTLEVPSPATVRCENDVSHFLGLPETALEDLANGFRGPDLLSEAGALRASFAWVRTLAKDAARAKEVGDWVAVHNADLKHRLGELVAELPGYEGLLHAYLQGYSKIIEARGVGYQLAKLPFVVSAIALLARMRAWRIISLHTPVSRSALDDMVRFAHRHAPLSFERELLVADLLLGTWYTREQALVPEGAAMTC